MQQTWPTASKALASFKEILSKQCPKPLLFELRYKLSRSLDNISFYNEMRECGALLNWDSDNNIFDPPWTQATIEAAVKAIEDYYSKDPGPNNNGNISGDEKIMVRIGSYPVEKIKSDEMAPRPVAILRLKFLENKSEEGIANQRQVNKLTSMKFQFLDPTGGDSSTVYQRVAPKLLIETGYNMEEEKTPEPVNPDVTPRKSNKSLGKKQAVFLKWEWHSLAGESLEFTDPLNFIKISDIIEQPKFTNKDTQLLRSLLPFILQKIKMWDCKILTPDYLSQLLPISEEEPSWKDDDDMEDFNEKNAQTEENSCKNIQVLSKLDILTLLASSTEITVLADIFQNISKFPIALPIILPNPIPNKNGKMLMVTTALEKCLIRWEQKGKSNGENYLFKNPYKLITAIRIGDTESAGKSSFLNQIFLQSNIFQCKGQPGNGKPIGLNGSAEFIWLTKDTCKESIWSAIQTEMEDSADNEIVLLGNVHGDALQNEETLLAMNAITSKYIVFVMPNEVTGENKEKLAKLLDKENLLFIYVDPQVAVDNLKTLRTHLITDSNATLTKLKQYIRQALKTSRNIPGENPNSKLIAEIPAIASKESKNFIKLVHQLNNSQGYVRDLLSLQKIKKAEVDQYWRTYTDSTFLIKLIENFTKILLAPLPERRIGLAHAEQELAIISAKKLTGFSSKLVGLLEKRNRLVDTDPHWEETNGEIAKINKEFENSLSLNDFLRELSIAYEIIFIHGLPEAISLISKLPALYAELLIEGRTLEILDGDTGSVPGLWLESVCHEVCQKLGTLKVFVVSILGLQSSGKSTLLNALFGCKFATSVGKCTKGLYMRLMLLEKSFKKQLGLDAILVVDTEGLGSPESMLDPNSESKDRTMATFAMTISNLTLINVAGESNKEMVDILQIVILTMARMEKTDLSPDLLLVQQVPEGGHEALLAKGVDNFCKALEEAVKVIQSQEIDLGVRTLTNLKTLKQRLRQREILYQLRPFKSGASPQSPPSEEYCQDVLGLRNRIIKEYSIKNHYIYFCAWHKLLKSYWSTVQKENFALRFTSMRQVQEFIEVNTRIAVVKNDLDMVFQHHRSSVDIYINEKLNVLNKATVTNKFEREIHEKINSTIDQLPGHCQPDSILCKWCIQAEISRKNLLEFVRQTSSVSVNDTETNIKACVEDMRKTSKTQILRRFESLKIKHGKASEFDTILNNIMQNSKESEMSVEGVWNELQSTVQSKYPIGFNKGKVFFDIANAYSHIPDVTKWKCELEKMSFSDNDPKPSLALEKAKKNKKRLKLSKPNLNLTANEHNWLCGKLREISENIVANRRQERVGYAETLVLEHKRKIVDMLQKFEERFKTSLKNQFKHDAMFYSLQIFVEHIFHLQAEWDRQNEPFCVLLKQKQEYVQKISMYLAIQSPTQINSYGQSIAKQLLEAAQSVCVSSLQVTNYFEKWATHSEGIRLRYFISLAEELKRGDDQVVLGHFQDPQGMISEWYIQTIEYAMQNIVAPMLKETFTDECIAIGNQIGSTKSIKELLTFLNWYLNKVGESVTLEKVTEDMQEKLMAEIQKQMSKLVKDYMDQIRVENLPVNEDVFLNILGCTATCPGCGALCWGAKNHENGLARYKRHFTCHQPKGLAGVIDESSGTLDFKSCCNYEDDEDDNEEKFDGSDRVGNDDVQWLNESHPVEEYSQLMDWFFLKLKGKLTEKFGSKLPRNDPKETARLAYLTYLDKHLDHILNLIKHKSLL